MNKLVWILVLLMTAATLTAQESGYEDLSKMKGFPSLVKHLAPYDKALDDLRFISLEEEPYNRLFYRSHITERGSGNAFFTRFDLIFTRKFALNLSRMPRFEFVINPLLGKNQLSRHRFTLSRQIDSYVATLAVSEVDVIFPVNAIKSSAGDTLVARVELSQMAMRMSDGQLEMGDVRGVEMPAFRMEVIPLEVSDANSGKLTFKSRQKHSIFESNELAQMVTAAGKNAGMRESDYLCGFSMSGIYGSVMLNGHLYPAKVTELVFAQYLTAGVLEIMANDKEMLARDIAIFSQGKPNKHIKPDFKMVNGLKGSTYHRFTQDYKNVYMYFVAIH